MHWRVVMALSKMYCVAKKHLVGFELPLVLQGQVHMTAKRPQTGPDLDRKRPDHQSGLFTFWIAKTAKNRLHRTGYDRSLTRPTQPRITLPRGIKTHQKLSKSVKNWVRYHQNRVLKRKELFNTRFWWYLTQFLADWLNFWCVLMPRGRERCIKGDNNQSWPVWTMVFT